MTTESPIGPMVHQNLFAVEQIVVFRNVTLIRASNAEDALSIAEMDTGGTYFQNHVSTAPSNVTKITDDAQILAVLQSTEQPTLTLEEFTEHRDKWLRNCVVE